MHWSYEIHVYRQGELQRVTQECDMSQDSNNNFQNSLYVLYDDVYCCSLGGLIDHGTELVGNEAAAKHIAMCILLSLEVSERALMMIEDENKSHY